MVDYTSFVSDKDPRGKAAREKRAIADQVGKAGFWWKEEDPSTRALLMVAAAESLEKDQRDRHNLNLLHARLYGNFDLLGFGARQYSRGNAAASSRIAFNVVEAATDTLAAKVSKHRPRPVFLTDGAQWAEQQKAKKQGHFVEGMFSHSKVYSKADLVWVDACVFGTGGFKLVMDDDGKVNVERVFVDEIYMDDADALYGAPKQYFQGKLCHREQLAADFPDFEKEIMEARSPNGVEQSGMGDMVQVWEGWHLPSGSKKVGGCHCIALSGGVELYCKPWTLSRPPFVFFHYKPRLRGFWGQGVAELLTGVQLELNRLVRSISEQLRRKGRGRIFLPLGARVSPDFMTNAIADVIPYTGNVPPTVDSSNAVAQEEFMQIDRLYQKAFQLVGVSEMSVSAKKPSGLDAGVALREYEEIESERFAKQHQRWDAFFMELAEAKLDFVREFGGEDYISKYEHKRYMSTIKWSDIVAEPGTYKIQIFPSSSLPQTPAARRQAVKELEADGKIDSATGLKLLDFPDIQTEMNLGIAAQDDCDAAIDRVLNGDGSVTMPDKYSNLDMFVERGTAALLYARNHDADPERIEKLSAMIDTAAAASVAAKAPIMPAGQPTALPMPGEMPAPGGAPGPINVEGSAVNVPATPAVPPLIA